MIIENIHNFWNDISYDEIDIFHSNLSDYDVSKQRNDIEFGIINKFLNPVDNKNIIDLGCGPGRLIDNFINKDISFNMYNGYDYSEPYVKFCKTNYSNDNINFYETDFEKFNIVNNNYNIFICSAVFQYLSDDAIDKIFDFILKNDIRNVYYKMTIHLTDGMVIDDKYSEKLKKNYSAIYRAKDYYDKLNLRLLDNGYKLEDEGFLFLHLQYYKETPQYYYILRKA